MNCAARTVLRPKGRAIPGQGEQGMLTGYGRYIISQVTGLRSARHHILSKVLKCLSMPQFAPPIMEPLCSGSLKCPRIIRYHAYQFRTYESQ